MSGPKQYVVIGGVSIPTEEFVKNREEILARYQKEETKQEPGQMMKKPIEINVAQKKFEEELKAVELKEEIGEETPVPTVEIGETSDVEVATLTQPKVNTKKVPVGKKKGWK